MGLPPKKFEVFVARVRPFLRRHWQKALQVREKLALSEEAFHLLLAGGVGVIGAVINVLFYLAVEGAQDLLSSHLGRNVVDVVATMDLPSRVLVPTLGGLGAGLVLFWGFRFAGKYRTTNLLEVVVAGDGRLPFRVGVIRAVSSLISIGTGASIPIASACWSPAAPRRAWPRPTTRRSQARSSPPTSSWEIFP